MTSVERRKLFCGIYDSLVSVQTLHGYAKRNDLQSDCEHAIKKMTVYLDYDSY